MELSRLDYVILMLLKKQNCTSHFKSMTIQEIISVTGTSRPSTYRKLINLFDNGFVKKGCKSTNALTFYLTEKSLNLLNENGGKVND